jgi:hypothetical protein
MAGIVALEGFFFENREFPLPAWKATHSIDGLSFGIYGCRKI